MCCTVNTYFQHVLVRDFFTLATTVLFSFKFGNYYLTID